MANAYRGLGFVVILFAAGALCIGIKAQGALHLSDNEALAAGAGCFAVLCILWGEWIDSDSRLIMAVAHWGWLTALIIAGGYGWDYYSQHPAALKADLASLRDRLEQPPSASPGPRVADPPPAPARPADTPATSAAAAEAAPPATQPTAPPASPPPRPLRTPVHFNCATGRRYGADYVICADAGLLDAEAGLEAAYAAARAALDDDATRKRLSREQSAWSKRYGPDCGLPAIGQPPEITTPARQCVARALADRTAYLQGIPAPPAPPATVSPEPASDALVAPAEAAGSQRADQPVAPPAPTDSAGSTDDRDPIEVEKQATNVQGAGFLLFPYPWVIHITSKTGSVTLNNLSINRGNCKIWTLNAESRTLKFGDAYDVWAGCDPVEAIVSTDRGDFRFSW